MLDHRGSLGGRFAFEATVTVMGVMKPLKIFTLPLQTQIALEPLAPEKLFVVCIVKVFNNSVPPRFSDRNKNRVNIKEQA